MTKSQLCNTDSHKSVRVLWPSESPSGRRQFGALWPQVPQDSICARSSLPLSSHAQRDGAPAPFPGHGHIKERRRAGSGLSHGAARGTTHQRRRPLRARWPPRMTPRTLDDARCICRDPCAHARGRAIRTERRLKRVVRSRDIVIIDESVRDRGPPRKVRVEGLRRCRQ